MADERAIQLRADFEIPGMLTDSRSFMSYTRHEYFRRVLCDMFGRDMENGELPDNDELVGPVVRDICYGNAHRFLGLNVA